MSGMSGDSPPSFDSIFNRQAHETSDHDTSSVPSGNYAGFMSSPPNPDNYGFTSPPRLTGEPGRLSRQTSNASLRASEGGPSRKITIPYDPQSSTLINTASHGNGTNGHQAGFNPQHQQMMYYQDPNHTQFPMYTGQAAQYVGSEAQYAVQPDHYVSTAFPSDTPPSGGPVYDPSMAGTNGSHISSAFSQTTAGDWGQDFVTQSNGQEFLNMNHDEGDLEAELADLVRV